MQECQNVEWKKNWKDEFLKWTCGFANANGGRIFIGKIDKGEIAGLKRKERNGMEFQSQMFQVHI